MEGLRIIFAFIIFNKPHRGLLHHSLGKNLPWWTCRIYVMLMFVWSRMLLGGAPNCTLIHEVERTSIHLETFNSYENLCYVSKMPEIPGGQTSLSGERSHLQPCVLHLCLTVNLQRLVRGCGTIWWGWEKRLAPAGVIAVCSWPRSVQSFYMDLVPPGKVWNTASPVAMNQEPPWGHFWNLPVAVTMNHSFSLHSDFSFLSSSSFFKIVWKCTQKGWKEGKVCLFLVCGAQRCASLPKTGYTDDELFIDFAYTEYLHFSTLLLFLNRTPVW